jgi:hypothetical protein
LAHRRGHPPGGWQQHGTTPVTSVGDGPLTSLGPATRWCLTAGIAANQGSPPRPEYFASESDQIVREGLAAVAFHALTEFPAHREQPYFLDFHEVARASQMQSMGVDAAGAHLLGDLATAGVRAAVVKGPAMAALHPRGWPRPYADIDIVVLPDQFDKAVAAGKAAGFVYPERAMPQWPWFDRLCREGINLHSPTGGNVDIHHHVSPWVLGSGLPTSDVIERSEVAELCGVPVRFATPEDLVVVSALHVVNDRWKGKLGLTSWRDLLVVMDRIGNRRAASAFEHAELEWLFDVMSDEISRALPDIPVESPGHPPVLTWTTRIRLASSGGAHDSLATRQRLAWATRLPPAHSIAFIAGSLVPSADYVRARDGSYRSYWRRGVHESISTLRGSDYRMAAPTT